MHKKRRKGMSPKISVIVPVYKVEKYLRKCLDSILNQTFQDFELILVSDGPEEDDLICEEYAQKYKNITLIKGVNKGPGGARNVGLDIAKGDYIAFIDSDDWIESDYLAKMYNAMISNKKIDVIQCGTNTVFEGNVDKKLLEHDNKYFAIKRNGIFNFKNSYYGSINVGPWNKLYKKSLIKKHNLKFPENMYNEDAYFTWAYWAVCKKIYFIPDKLYNYLRRDDSSMSKVFQKKFGEKIINHIDICNLLYEFLIRNNLYNARKEGFLRACMASYYFINDFAIDEYFKIGYEKLHTLLKNVFIPLNFPLLIKIKKYHFEEFKEKEHENSFLQNIFSIRNTENKKQKIITLFALKFIINKKVKMELNNA